MHYSIRIKRSAARELDRVPKTDRQPILHTIDRLAEQPLAGSALKGELRGLRRVRVGNYRVVYELLNTMRSSYSSCVSAIDRTLRTVIDIDLPTARRYDPLSTVFRACRVARLFPSLSLPSMTLTTSAPAGEPVPEHC